MTRALDHIVWPTRDLDALAGTFDRLGFTVGRRNRHPWGTVNHIIQFDGAFLELLGFAEDYVPLAEADPAYPFAEFCRAFLGRHEAGAAMLVLRSDDALAEAPRLRAAGLGTGRTFPFSRSAQGPDGRDRTVAFTLAFAELPRMPDLGAFLCQQHRPENFWNRDAQVHRNGALGMGRLGLCGPEPSAHVDLLRRVADGGPDGATPIVVLGDGCRIEAGQARSGEACRLDAVGIRVTDEAALASALEAAGIPFDRRGTVLVVTSPTLGSTALTFEAAEHR